MIATNTGFWTTEQVFSDQFLLNSTTPESALYELEREEMTCYLKGFDI